MRPACVALVLAAAQCAGEPANARQPDRPAGSSPVATARRTTETIHIDGRLDESDWQRVEPIGPLHQREPVENSEPSEQTIVRVLYDDRALYIGVVCRDASAREIVSTQLTRDADLDVDDRITIVLDPFFDHRNGFFKVSMVCDRDSVSTYGHTCRAGQRMAMATSRVESIYSRTSRQT
ncbi:MAG: hypothetical protein DMF98_17010 [Acidobacteria bacterium]|nr:MAG: hypothetical protein DMF98_17010 [Acidobacteriota bacterium]